MAFTQVTVTGTIEDQPLDQEVYVTFLLNEPISDGVSLVAAELLTAVGNSSNQISIALNANDDSTTTPTGSYYEVSVYAGGDLVDSFNVIIPHADAPTVDLFSLSHVA